ncbi:MAG: hypothetical protein DMG60_18835 [Acidobacteria bacterium]|nr:MAG: hypothetical protein DMG60_18835 [Acidobacteriota bacterium]
MEMVKWACLNLQQNQIGNRRLWLSRTLGVLVALLLTMSVYSSMCLGTTSATDADDGRSSPPVTEIPFQLYNDNLIVVKGSIGSITRLNLILDTGTTHTALSKLIISRLNLRGNTESLQTFTGATQTQSFVLPHIELGAISAEDVRVVVQDLGFLKQNFGISVAGIVGIDVLSRCNFSIDYRKGKIVFGSIPPTKHTVPFVTRTPLLTVKTMIEREEVRLLLDSGTPGLLVFRNRLKTPLAPLPSVPPALMATTAGATPAHSFRAAVALGKESLGVHTLQIADVDFARKSGFDGLMGFAALGFRRVSFDFQNGIFGWE